MRILLFTGKGGVGKTTAAAATALRLAGRGHKTLVLSADPAHSLADAFGVASIGDRPTEVAPGLMAAQVDGLARMQQRWAGGGDWPAITAQLSATLSAGGLDPILAEELAVLPGLDELMVLMAVADEVAAGLYDSVVVDCAPTGQTLRLLALPEVLDRFLDRLYPVHQRMLRSLGLLGRDRPSAPPGGAAKVRSGEALAVAVHRLHEGLVTVRAILTDPAITRIRLVVTPESLALAEARRAATALALFGYAVDGVVVNRVVAECDLELPGMPPWMTAWADSQRRVLADVTASFPDLPISCVHHRGAEPVGAQNLDEVADQLYGRAPQDVDPQTGPEQAPIMQVVTADGGNYLLRLRMPHVRSTELTLNRVGDELAITVGGHRRLLALPGLLARCRVVGATVADGFLSVRFEPDPQRWPQDLLRARAEATGFDS